MTTNALLAVGIAKLPGFERLPGASNAAKAMGEWGRANGYDVAVLTDDAAGVGIDDVEAALLGLIGDRRIARLVIFFAGHGIERGAGEEIWLTSDWRKAAISVPGLRRRLDRCPLDGLVIFSDACRSLATNPDLADVDALSVLRVPTPLPAAVPTDVFKAAPRFSAAYMLPGSSPGHEQCLFSGVLVRALSGEVESAFDDHRPRHVTSASLGRHLRTEVSDRAREYGLELTPDLAIGLFEPDDVYLGPESPRLSLLPPWPHPDALRRGPDDGGSRSGGFGGDKATQSLSFGIDPRVFGGAPRASSFADRVNRERRAAAKLDQLSSETLARLERADATGDAAEDDRLVGSFSEREVALVLRGAHARLISQGGAAEEFEEAIAGRVWIGRAATGEPARPAHLVMNLEDDRWISPLLLPGWATIWTFYGDRAGTTYVRTAGSSTFGARMAREVLAGADGAASTEEYVRHVEAGGDLDPVASVVSGYRLQGAGRTDRLRALGLAHVERNVPLPLDLALLLSPEPLDPSVRGVVRPIRLDWGEVEASVVGLLPMMRQGWAFLGEIDDLTLAARGSRALSDHLEPGPFTVFDRDAGSTLARYVGGMSA